MNDEPKISEEIEKMEYEPLIPIEKKLILWSIGLGVFLLVALYFISKLIPGIHT